MLLLSQRRALEAFSISSESLLEIKSLGFGIFFDTLQTFAERAGHLASRDRVAHLVS